MNKGWRIIITHWFHRLVGWIGVSVTAKYERMNEWQHSDCVGFQYIEMLVPAPTMLINNDEIFESIWSASGDPPRAERNGCAWCDVRVEERNECDHMFDAVAGTIARQRENVCPRTALTNKRRHALRAQRHKQSVNITNDTHFVDWRTDDGRQEARTILAFASAVDKTRSMRLFFSQFIYSCFSPISFSRFLSFSSFLWMSLILFGSVKKKTLFTPLMSSEYDILVRERL